jgi:hypothetical protein
MTAANDKLRNDRLASLHWVASGPEALWHLSFGGPPTLCGAELPTRRLIRTLRDAAPQAPKRCETCLTVIRTRLDI